MFEESLALETSRMLMKFLKEVDNNTFEKILTITIDLQMRKGYATGYEHGFKGLKPLTTKQELNDIINELKRKIDLRMNESDG